jgi:hypothetical protein
MRSIPLPPLCAVWNVTGQPLPLTFLLTFSPEEPGLAESGRDNINTVYCILYYTCTM